MEHDAVNRPLAGNTDAFRPFPFQVENKISERIAQVSLCGWNS